MGIAALMLTAGVFLVMAGIRDESVPSIIADVIGGKTTSSSASTPASSSTPPVSGFDQPAAFNLLPPGVAGPVLDRP